MTPKIFNILFATLSFTAALGVFIHDSQIYKVAKVSSLDNTVILNRDNAGELKLVSTGSHVHVDSGAFLGLGHQQPATQPRDRDDKRYVAVRRLIGSSFGSEYSWPFI